MTTSVFFVSIFAGQVRVQEKFVTGQVLTDKRIRYNGQKTQT